MEDLSFFADQEEVLPKKVEPQVIGREFVRQYYLRLHHKPNDLHKFYMNESTLVHDAIEFGRMAVSANGIKEIVSALSSEALNYQGCHTRVSKLDTMTTLDNGILIQVHGDISNDGVAMRPFAQTVVLKALAFNKYAVLNDIFRYCDLVMPDETNGLCFMSGEELDDGHNEAHQADEVNTNVQQPAAIDTATLPTTNQSEQSANVPQDVNDLATQLPKSPSPPLQEADRFIAEQSEPIIIKVEEPIVETDIIIDLINDVDKNDVQEDIVPNDGVGSSADADTVNNVTDSNDAVDTDSTNIDSAQSAGKYI